MARSFGEPLTKLRKIPIIDNGEPLIDPRTLSTRISLAPDHPKFMAMKRTPVVRKQVAEMLVSAANSLPGGIDMQLFQGYRSLDQQRWMYKTIKDEFAAKHPDWSKATLHRITNTMSAPPEDKCPPPHTTGGAFDVALISTLTGEPLDFCSPYEMDERSAPMDIKGLLPEVQKNRQLLSDVLSATGLTNYVGEWWHWSYGDSGWALRVGAPHAIYGPITFEDQ